MTKSTGAGLRLAAVAALVFAGACGAWAAGYTPSEERELTRQYHDECMKTLADPQARAAPKSVQTKFCKCFAGEMAGKISRADSEAYATGSAARSGKGGFDQRTIRHEMHVDAVGELARG